MKIQIDDRGQSLYEDRLRNAWKASPPVEQTRFCKTDSRGMVEDGEVDCVMADGSSMRVPLVVRDAWVAKKAADACACDTEADDGQGAYEERIRNAWRTTA